jgi:restriction endonuclease S subunit
MRSDIRTHSNFWVSSIPPGWQYRNLEELCLKIVDNRGKTAPTSDHGIPLIATNCISNERMYPIYDKVRYVSPDTYRSWFRDHPQPGDIIFVNKGTPGRVSLVPKPVDFCIAQDMVAIRPNKELVDDKYLFALLRSTYFQKQVEAFHVGTLIPHLKKGDFKELIVPIPPKSIQNFIGKYYYDISLRITILEKVNINLNNIMQAIFKSWFIDFDGVSKFISTELGDIPTGWQIIPIGHAAEFANGFSYRGSEKYEQTRGFLFVTLNSIKEEGGFKKEYAWLDSNRLKEINFVKEMDLIIANTEQTNILSHLEMLENPTFLIVLIFVSVYKHSITFRNAGKSYISYLN